MPKDPRNKDRMHFFYFCLCRHIGTKTSNIKAMTKLWDAEHNNCIRTLSAKKLLQQIPLLKHKVSFSRFNLCRVKILINKR